MNLAEIEAGISLLLTRMQNEPEDRHELYFQIMEKLNEMRAYGMEIPQDLIDLERGLEAEFTADKMGMSGPRKLVRE